MTTEHSDEAIDSMRRETAVAICETGPVCDGCLGRCFADRDSDQANAPSGAAIVQAVTKEIDAPVATVDPVDCWVCEGLTVDVEAWTDRVLEAVDDLAFETFQLGVHVPTALEARETELREGAGLEADAGESIKAEYKRTVGIRLVDHLDAAVDFEYPDVVIVLDLEGGSVDLQLNPAYLGGRYRKVEGGLEPRIRVCRSCNGQGTEWREGESMPCEACDGSGYDTKESVEWYIAEAVREAMDGAEAVFNAAGREDMDVLVLGEGRPFVVEVKEARHRPPDMAAIQEAIQSASDGALVVEGLARAHRDLVEHLTQTPIQETYRFEVSFAEAVSSAAFRDAIDELDSGSVRQRIERDGRATDLIQQLGHISGELIDDTEAIVEVEMTKGVDFEALLVGGADRSEPNLADLVETEVTVESIAVVAIEGRDESLELDRYLSDEG